MGVSLTPIREALMRLVSDGALELDSRGVAWVPRVHPDRYTEIIELRIELEGRAAARAAQLATPQDIEQLREIQKRLLDARLSSNFAVVLAENEQFHFTVLAIARMPVLQRLVESLWVQVGPTINLLFTVPRDVSPSNHPHNAWIAAMADGDAAGARAALEHDLRANAEIVLPLLARDLQSPLPARAGAVKL
jgi:DNA-binding GntR family transcriptional regulator